MLWVGGDRWRSPRPSPLHLQLDQVAQSPTSMQHRYAPRHPRGSLHVPQPWWWELRGKLGRATTTPALRAAGLVDSGPRNAALQVKGALCLFINPCMAWIFVSRMPSTRTLKTSVSGCRRCFSSSDSQQQDPRRERRSVF